MSKVKKIEGEGVSVMTELRTVNRFESSILAKSRRMESSVLIVSDRPRVLEVYLPQEEGRCKGSWEDNAIGRSA